MAPYREWLEVKDVAISKKLFDELKEMKIPSFEGTPFATGLDIASHAAVSCGHLLLAISFLNSATATWPGDVENVEDIIDLTEYALDEWRLGSHLPLHLILMSAQRHANTRDTAFYLISLNNRYQELYKSAMQYMQTAIIEPLLIKNLKAWNIGEAFVAEDGMEKKLADTGRDIWDDVNREDEVDAPLHNREIDVAYEHARFMRNIVVRTALVKALEPLVEEINDRGFLEASMATTLSLKRVMKEYEQHMISELESAEERAYQSMSEYGDQMRMEDGGLVLELHGGKQQVFRLAEAGRSKQ